MAEGLEPLRWAPAHPVILDDHGGGYHRVFCGYVDDQDGTTGRWLEAGQPLPRNESLHACPHCKPELVLVEDRPKRRGIFGL